MGSFQLQSLRYKSLCEARTRLAKETASPGPSSCAALPQPLDDSPAALRLRVQGSTESWGEGRVPLSHEFAI